MRACAIDLGTVRTGIAFSDIELRIVGKTEVLHERNEEKLLLSLASTIKENDAIYVAMGCPVNMDGTKGQGAERSEKLAKQLSELTGIDVVLIDERRTTMDAHRILGESGVYGKKRKNTVDAVAAALILEIFLNLLKNKEVNT